jgi:hypothetical protein
VRLKDGAADLARLLACVHESLVGVQALVHDRRQDFQVRRPVVPPFLVAVVHVLVGLQCAADLLLHEVTMQ